MKGLDAKEKEEKNEKNTDKKKKISNVIKGLESEILMFDQKIQRVETCFDLEEEIEVK